MFFDDTTHIDTPEGVHLELTLAGLGSRITAQLLDGLIKAVVVLFVLVALANSELGVALSITVAAVIVLGFEIIFEMLWVGQTPGKRAMKLRVVMTDGGSVTFAPVVVRNLLRLIDFLPGAYAVGAVLAFTTKKAQRLGDLVAGTIVVRERKPRPAPIGLRGLDRVTVPPGFDATAVTSDQVVLCRNFLARRTTLEYATRLRMAQAIEAQLAQSVVDPTGELVGEGLIEVVLAVKTGASGMS
jgi:uncharacterized RDD family membrane protein YckC